MTPTCTLSCITLDSDYVDIERTSSLALQQPCKPACPSHLSVPIESSVAAAIQQQHVAASKAVVQPGITTAAAAAANCMAVGSAAIAWTAAVQPLCASKTRCKESSTSSHGSNKHSSNANSSSSNSNSKGLLSPSSPVSQPTADSDADAVAFDAQLLHSRNTCSTPGDDAAEPDWCGGSSIATGSSSVDDGSSDTFSDIGDPGATEVVYVCEGVAVWPSKHARILGRLSLVKQHAVLFLAWLPYRAPAAATAASAVQPPATAAGESHSRTPQTRATLQDPSRAMADHVGPVGRSVSGATAAAADVAIGDDSDGSYVEDAWILEQPQQQWLHADTSALSNVPSRLFPKQQQQQYQQQHAGDGCHSQPIAAIATWPSLQRTVSSLTAAGADAGRSLYAIHPIPLSDIRAFVRHTPPLGWHHVVVVLVSGLTLPPLFFHQGGVKEFLRVLRTHVPLIRVAGSPATYLVNDTADPLQRCLLTMELADITIGAPPPGASCVDAPIDGPLANGAWQAVEAAATAPASHHTATAATSSGPWHAVQAAAIAAAVRARMGSQSQLLARGVATVAHAAETDAVAATAVIPAAASPQAVAVHSSVGTTPHSHGTHGSGSSSSRGQHRPRPLPADMLEAPTPWTDHFSSLGGAFGSHLSSTLGNTLTNTLSKVGQLAVEGASCLVAAAVESWHAEALRHFEREVDLPLNWCPDSVSEELHSGQELVSLESNVQSSEDNIGIHTSDTAQTIEALSSSPGPSFAIDGHAAAQSSPAAAPAAATMWQHAGIQPAVVAAAKQAGAASYQQQLYEQQRQQCASACAPLAPTAAAAVGAAAAAQPSGSAIETDLGLFELLEGAPTPDQLTTVRARPPPPPVSTEELQSFLNDKGVMVDEAGFRERVFQAGIEPTARHEAWKYLLGVYPSGSSSSEQQQQRHQLEVQYATLKGQWQSIGPDQARRFAKWRERRSRIDKDVRRTDRLHPFYRGRDAAAHLTGLRDVLRAYSLFNFDLGYCQGMSDLASPLLVVMEGDEVDAFWCFVGLMERLESNFHTDQRGMHAQLTALRGLVQVLDPPLHALFEERDCLNYFFAFRWLLIHFKREFPFDQVLSLWEACWSCPLTPHLHLYMAAAVLIQQRRVLLTDTALDFDGLLRFCVELAGKIDLQGTLRLAEVLVVIAGQAGRHCLAGLS